MLGYAAGGDRQEWRTLVLVSMEPKVLDLGQVWGSATQDLIMDTKCGATGARARDEWMPNVSRGVHRNFPVALSNA